MAAREQLVNDVGKIEEAFDLVCHFFDVPELLEDQKEALRQFFSGKELYFSAPTGFGKSLIFQCIPLINDLWDPTDTSWKIMGISNPYPKYETHQYGSK